MLPLAFRSANVAPAWLRLVQVGKEVLVSPFVKCLGKAMVVQGAAKKQITQKKAGLASFTNTWGHGIGRIMHENPQVPILSDEMEETNFRLEEVW